MENNTTPPPYPPIPPVPSMNQVPKGRNLSFGNKIIILAIQCCVLMLGALIIWRISYSHEVSNDSVAQNIAEKWGDKVYVEGPIIRALPDSGDAITPNVLDCKAEIETKSLHRNIYEVEVFTGKVSMTGSFRKSDVSAIDRTAYVKIDIEPKQVSNLSPLTIGGKTVEWESRNDGLYAEITIAGMPDNIDFSTDFNVRGSSELYFMPIASQSNIIINGNSPNPSFQGGSLPDDRSVKHGRFSARWENDDVIGNEGIKEYVGVNFLVGVDRYRKVSRSLKYAFLFIVLTYISVLLLEVLQKREIPLFNYFLIGIALIIFYTLLLGFAEHLSFGLSYLIASVMTVALIAGYIWKMLESRKTGIVIGAILTVLYVSCYILLNLSTYALLLGSILLFAALAVMMYASLRINR